MKNKVFLLALSLIFLGQTFIGASAVSYSNPSGLRLAIKKYKAGNYTGCLQDMQAIVSRDPSNAIAYYYIAMSYAKAGKKDKAVEAYSKVLTLKPNALLTTYATKGQRCLQTPDKCNETDTSSDIDRMIATPYGDGLSDKVRSSVEKQHLERVREEINNNKDMNNYQFRQFNDYSKQRSDAEADGKKTSSNEGQPTNDEIVAAIKVLNKAGLNPYSQINAQAALPQNAEYSQMSALLGNGNQSNSNSMMNMVPFMLAQSKNGGNNQYAAQMMQNMILNSTLPDFNYNTDKDKY